MTRHISYRMPRLLDTCTLLHFMYCIASIRASTAASDEILGVVLFHRHGDRTPYMLMPNDKENNAKWKLGKGQLTPQGMKQEYFLGKALRERYVEQYQFLSPSYRREEYYVRSTDLDRTIQSAQSALSGLFPLGTGPEIVSQDDTSTPALPSRQQPIPVHTIPGSEDELLLAYDAESCPAYGKAFQQLLQSDEVQQKYQLHSATLRNAEKVAGFNPGTLTIDTVSQYIDVLKCEEAHQMKWLQGFIDDPSIFAIGSELYNWLLAKRFESPKMKFLGGGAMLSQVIYRLQRSAGITPTISEPYETVDPETGLKVAHFSAHDTSVAAILSAISRFDGRNPPYASSVVFEAYREKKTDSVKVRVFYNRGVESIFQSEPIALECCQGSQHSHLRHSDSNESLEHCSSCDILEFSKYYGELVQKDHHRECGRGSTRDPMIPILLGIILLMSIVSAFFTYRYWMLRSEYQLIESS